MTVQEGSRRTTAPAWDPRPLAAGVAAGGVALLLLATVAGLAAPAPLLAAGPALLVAAALVGLPHGAVDHLALGWAAGRTGPARPRVLALYAVAAVAVAAAALAAPLPALVVLLALSAAHFAEGEAAFDRLRGGAGRALPAAALGTAVVALPLALRPDQSRALLAALDPGLPGLLQDVRVPLLLATAVLVAAGLGSALRAGQARAAAELALVVGAALLAPALVVFAAWFAGWHSARHLVRLLALEPDGGLHERALRLARGAALPTLAAVSGLVGLALLLGGLPGAVLVVLLALTVPHAAVVARLGRLRRAPGIPAGRSG